VAATDPAAAVIRYIDAVRDGDVEAIRGAFAEDATWDYPGDLPLSGTWRGRDAIVGDFLGGVGTLLQPDAPLALELTNVISDGAQVVATGGGPHGPPPAAAPLTTTPTAASSPSGTARSPPCGSTPTPSMSSTCCSGRAEGAGHDNPRTPARAPPAQSASALTMLLAQQPLPVPSPAGVMTATVELPPGDPGPPPHRHSGTVFGHMLGRGNDVRARAAI